MTQVLAAIAPTVRPAPSSTRELRSVYDASSAGLVRHAHQVLAELSASNAKQFQPVIDALDREISAAGHGRN